MPKAQVAPKAKFRLLAGSHIEAGTTYTKGNVIESEADLVKLFGPEKFQRISGASEGLKDGNYKINPRAHQFPGGQVHDGKQVTGGKDTDGFQVSGVDAEEMEEDLTTATTKAPAEDDDEEGDDADFDSMTVKELQDYADKNDIDLGGAKVKADIVKKLKAG